MSNIQVQLRRGTTAQHGSFTGAQGEVTVDTDKNALVLHDGATAGGIQVARDAITATGSTTARSLENRFGDVVNVLDHGADNTGSVETSSHIQAAINQANTGGKGVVYFPAGTYLVNTEINCTVGFPGSGLTLLGADGFQTVISCSSNIVVFRNVERFTVKRLKLLQTGGTQGAVFATPNNRVTTHSLFEDLEINGFKFGLLWRYSTHNAVRNVRMYNVACGVRLARHADTITNSRDQTNPIAAGAWNQPAQNG